MSSKFDIFRWDLEVEEPTQEKNGLSQESYSKHFTHPQNAPNEDAAPESLVEENSWADVT